MNYHDHVPHHFIVIIYRNVGCGFQLSQFFGPMEATPVTSDGEQQPWLSSAPSGSLFSPYPEIPTSIPWRFSTQVLSRANSTWLPKSGNIGAFRVVSYIKLQRSEPHGTVVKLQFCSSASAHHQVAGSRLTPPAILPRPVHGVPTSLEDKIYI